MLWGLLCVLMIGRKRINNMIDNQLIDKLFNKIEEIND